MSVLDDFELDVVEAGADNVQVEATFPAYHRCPFKDEPDEGSVTITWLTTNGSTLELHSLRALLDSLDEWMVSHEEYTEALRQRLAQHVAAVSVSTLWTTAGGNVQVIAG